MAFTLGRRLLFGVVFVTLIGLLAIGQEGPESVGLGVLPTPAQPDGLWIKLELPEGRSAFQVGEHVKLAFTINQPAYVYIFNIPPNHQVLNVFPNEFTALKNPLQPGEYLLPDNNSYNLEVSETGGLGQEFFGAIASTQPLPVFEAQAKVLGALLGRNPQEFQNTASGAVQGVVPTPNQETLKKFNIAFIQIQTFAAQQSPPPAQGRLMIKSNPPARVLIDGQDFGFTLSDEFRQIPMNAGLHQIQLKRQGYQDFTQTITIDPQGERLFDVNLNRLPLPYFRFEPQQPQFGQPVQFTAVESEDIDGTIIKYEWDFESDGQIDATGFMATHFFRVGTHTVTLIVTDDQGGTNRLTQVINVLR